MCYVFDQDCWTRQKTSSSEAGLKSNKKAFCYSRVDIAQGLHKIKPTNILAEISKFSPESTQH